MLPQKLFDLFAYYIYYRSNMLFSELMIYLPLYLYYRSELFQVNCISKCQEFVFWQQFGKVISDLLIYKNESKLQYSILNFLTLIVLLNINIFAFSIYLRVFSKCNNALIVTTNNDRVYYGVYRRVSSNVNWIRSVEFL